MTDKPAIPKDTEKKTVISHPGMMGDGTEEQNLGERGDPAARIKKDEVDAAFGRHAPQEAIVCFCGLSTPPAPASHKSFDLRGGVESVSEASTSARRLSVLHPACRTKPQSRVSYVRSGGHCNRYIPTCGFLFSENAYRRARRAAHFRKVSGRFS